MENNPDDLLRHIHHPGHRPHDLERVPLDSIFELGHKGLVGNKTVVIGSWLSFDITLTQQKILDDVNYLSGHIKGLDNLSRV